MKTAIITRFYPLFLAFCGTLHAGSIGATLTYPGELGQIGSHPEELTLTRSGNGINAESQVYNWSLSASGKLATAELKAKAQVNNGADTGVILTLNDRVFVTGPPLSSTNAVFEMDVDGHSSIATVCECFSAVAMVAYLRGDFGPQSIWQSSFDYAWNINTIGEGGTEFYKHNAAGDVDIREDTKGAWDFTLRITVPMTMGLNGQSASVNLTQFLQVKASQLNSGSAAIDAWDTAKLRIALEEGYSFGSESGLLLTAPSAPVPEPGTSLLVGFAGLVFLAARRAHRRQR